MSRIKNEKGGEKKERRRTRVKNSNGIRLAARWKSGLFSVLFSRFGFVVLLLILQILIMMTIWSFFKELLADYLIAIQIVFEVIVIMVLINRPMDSSAKLSWMLLITAMPLSGTLFYVWTTVEMGHGTVRLRLNDIISRTKSLIRHDHSTAARLRKLSGESYALGEYLSSYDSTTVYENVQTEYFPLGEAKLEKLLVELEKAEHFIFLEYFIIEEGYMWGKVLEILARKASEGVDVRVMYDGTCELSKLPSYYPQRLKKLGIKCKVWERIKPVVTFSYNYRDHRKILVIDGKTAFTGGINMADEYINRVSRFGHWKDTAVMLRGSAVDSFTMMFLQMWNVDEHEEDDYSKYLGHWDKGLTAPGYVIPYGDSPFNNHKLAEKVYMDILYNAKKYVYIMTPYLILDDELETALRYAAERGVDVRIILPGIPDKKPIWALAKRQYKHLVSAGVRIYEYTPGFVHAKVFLSDDIKAVVGTVNLDYRSLYHHFECGAYMVNVSCIRDILTDFRLCFAKCRIVTEETIRHEKLWIKLSGMVLKLIAPLL